MMLIPRILLFILMFLPVSWTRIAERNEAIEQAERYYAETKFEDAVRQHLLLISDYELNSEEVRFNLALSYQNNGQEADAEKTYKQKKQSELVDSIMSAADIQVDVDALKDLATQAE